MNIEIVDTASHPMLHITRSARMDPGQIAGVMREAFSAIGGFLSSKRIAATGAPLAVYRDWDGQTMQIDVGFPVSPSDAARAEGEVKSGHTAGGKALKAVHRGSYASLRQTYEAMEAHIKEAGLKTREIAWEVYLNDPDETPEEDLETEIYMPLA